MVIVASAKKLNVQPAKETRRPLLRVVRLEEEPIAVEPIESRVKREWRGVRARYMPKGYVSATKAAKILGYTYLASITSKIESGKLKGRKLGDGRIVVSEKKIEEFKVLREKLAPPKDAVPVARIYNGGEAIMTVAECNGAIVEEKATVGDTEEIKRDFVIRNTEGKEEKLKVYKDIDETRWLSKEDYEKILQSRRRWIRREEAAKLLGTTIFGLMERIDTKTRIASYMLPDGTTHDIRVVLHRKRCKFCKEDIEVAKKREKEMLEEMRFVPQICSVLGMNISGFRKWMRREKWRFEFTLNGKEHEIQMKRGKDSNAFYMAPQELEVLAKYRGIVTLATHARLGGWSFGMAEGMLQCLKIENSAIVVHESEGRRISVPLDNVDGVNYVEKKYAGVVKFYLEVNNKYSPKKRQAIEKLLGTELEPREEIAIKLRILEDAIKKESDAKLRRTVREKLTSEAVREIASMEITDERLVPAKVELKYALRNHPKLLGQISRFEEGRRGKISIASDFLVVLPVEGNNGTTTITREEAGLLDLHLSLFSPTNGEGGQILHQKVEVANRFLDRFERTNPIHVAGLWTVKEFVLGLRVELLVAEKSPNNRNTDPVTLLLDRLEEKQFMSVFEESYAGICSPYFLQKRPVSREGGARYITGCLVEGIM